MKSMNSKQIIMSITMNIMTIPPPTFNLSLIIKKIPISLLNNKINIINQNINPKTCILKPHISKRKNDPRDYLKPIKEKISLRKSIKITFLKIRYMYNNKDIIKARFQEFEKVMEIFKRKSNNNSDFVKEIRKTSKTKRFRNITIYNQE